MEWAPSLQLSGALHGGYGTARVTDQGRGDRRRALGMPVITSQLNLSLLVSASEDTWCMDRFLCLCMLHKSMDESMVTRLVILQDIWSIFFVFLMLSCGSQL